MSITVEKTEEVQKAKVKKDEIVLFRAPVEYARQVIKAYLKSCFSEFVIDAKKVFRVEPYYKPNPNRNNLLELWADIIIKEEFVHSPIVLKVLQRYFKNKEIQRHIPSDTISNYGL